MSLDNKLILYISKNEVYVEIDYKNFKKIYYCYNFDIYLFSR